MYRHTVAAHRDSATGVTRRRQSRQSLSHDRKEPEWEGSLGPADPPPDGDHVSVTWWSHP